ncbi:MAG: N-6 DNA methylase [Armatimonadetes bacterium]|nr:N-6 DNA methylase [Armatimonadota bacterium]
MLEKMLNLLQEISVDENSAWNKMIEFLIVDNQGRYFFQIDHKFEWLWEDEGFTSRFMSIYDSVLLRSDCQDHVGELYYKRMLNKTCSDNSSIRKILHQKGITYSSVGTGKEILQAAKKNPNTKYYGVESDIKLYRIALTNCIIHGVDVQLLNANPNEHDINVQTVNGRSNWKYANRWKVDCDKLKPVAIG